MSATFHNIPQFLFTSDSTSPIEAQDPAGSEPAGDISKITYIQLLIAAGLAADLWRGQADIAFARMVESTPPEERERIAQEYDNLAAALVDRSAGPGGFQKAFLVAYDLCKSALRNEMTGYPKKRISEAMSVFAKMLGG